MINTPTKTPVAIFAYKRPDHLRQTLSALEAADGYQGRKTYIFCDGPKTSKENVLVKEVRNVANEYCCGSQVEIFTNERNYGLANSIIEGVTQLLKKHETLIILEDDIVLSSKALRYFDNALKIYRNRMDIFSIGSYVPESLWKNFPNNYKFSTFLIPRMQCWGWATWSDKWKLFKNYRHYYDALMSNEQLKLGYKQIIGEDSFKTLRDCMENGKDVWACRWVLTHYTFGSSCVCPRYPLSINIGLDGSGTNCGNQQRQSHFISEEDLDQQKFYLGRKINISIFERFMKPNNVINNLNENEIATYSFSN